MPLALVSMADVAAFRGVHYDTVRKDWTTWVRDLGFPAPVAKRPYKWNPDSLAAWAERAEAANRAEALKPRPGDDATETGAPANQNVPDEPRDRPLPRPTSRAVDRQRDHILGLMSGRAS